MSPALDEMIVPVLVMCLAANCGPRQSEPVPQALPLLQKA